LNAEAIRVGSNFLQEAESRRERFLALGYIPSYKTLSWLSGRASGTYDVRQIGEFQGIVILEFTPRSR
jgi:hypothetical protein